jgi:hypothetical protein
VRYAALGSRHVARWWRHSLWSSLRKEAYFLQYFHFLQYFVYDRFDLIYELQLKSIRRWHINALHYTTASKIQSDSSLFVHNYLMLCEAYDLLSVDDSIPEAQNNMLLGWGLRLLVTMAGWCMWDVVMVGDGWLVRCRE